jgi:hypothetical protein
MTCVGNDKNTLTLSIQDNTIYKISRYLKVNIYPPSGAYQAYLYISLPDTEGVGITIPSNIYCSGDRLENARPGEEWEISMDSSLGTLLLNTTKLNNKQ